MQTLESMGIVPGRTQIASRVSPPIQIPLKVRSENPAADPGIGTLSLSQAQQIASAVPPAERGRSRPKGGAPGPYLSPKRSDDGRTVISESEARNPLPDGNYAVRNSRGKVYNMDVGLTSCARGKKSRRNAVPLADLLKPDAVITVEREYGSAGGRAVLR